MRTGNAQSTPAHPKEGESTDVPQKESMEGLLPLMVTTTTVPALIQGQGEMDNILSTLSGLTKEKQIGQLNVISSLRLLLNLSSRTMDEVINKGTKKDKSTPIVNTPLACPIEDRNNVVSSSTISDNTLQSEVSQTKSQKTDAIKTIASCQPISRNTNGKETAKLTYLGGAISFPPGGTIIQDPEPDWDYMGTESLIGTPRPSSTSSPRTPSHRRGKGLLGHNLDGETLPNYIGRGRNSLAPIPRRYDSPTTTPGRGRGLLSVIPR